MSKRVISVLGALSLTVVALASTTQGCGGGGGASSADVTAACENLCNKEATCNPAEATLIKASCMTSCSNTAAGGSTGSTSMTDCPGVSESDAISKANACAAGTCDALLSCIESICPSNASGGAGTGSTGAAGGVGTGSTGSAGTGAGSAGTTGTAGTGAGSAGTTGAGGFAFPDGGTSFGTTCATACAKADACCAAVNAEAGTTTACNFLTECNSAPTETATFVAICNETLDGVDTSPAAPAACK
jgi:hypothetical protein